MEATLDGEARCACCGRYPLVGEGVTVHAKLEQSSLVVCETCERHGRASRLGPVTATDRVRTLGGARNVRLLKPV